MKQKLACHFNLNAKNINYMCLGLSSAKKFHKCYINSVCFINYSKKTFPHKQLYIVLVLKNNTFLSICFSGILQVCGVSNTNTCV